MVLSSTFLSHVERSSCFICPGEFQKLLLPLEKIAFHAFCYMCNAFKSLDGEGFSKIPVDIDLF